MNARGFLRFPNLARLSRPSPLARKRRERKGDGGDEETCEPDKDKAYVVEVAGERREDDDDWKGLVGEEGIGRDTWRIGSTRLLLLEERYAERKVDELPEAVKDVLDHETQHDESSAFELIRCHLTLFYTYWSMSEGSDGALEENDTRRREHDFFDVEEVDGVITAPKDEQNVYNYTDMDTIIQHLFCTKCKATFSQI